MPSAGVAGNLIRGNMMTRRVLKINMEGKVIKDYGSCKEAAADNDLRLATVSERCRGKMKNTTGLGYDFCYADDDESAEKALKRIESHNAGVWVTNKGKGKLKKWS